MPNAEVVRGDSPFADLRVVEIATTPAGEQTGKFLADLGASVVKVEPPGGVPSRHVGPWAYGLVDPDHSLEFWTYNTSKQSVVIDATDAADRADFETLVAAADVVLLERPSWLAELGTDLTTLLADRPDLVVVTVTPFGLTGPWADYRSNDLVALAAGGMLNVCGYDDHSIPPIRPGGNQGYQLGASFAYCGLLLALIERENSGLGQLVDVSVHESNAVSGELANPYWFYPRALVQRQTCRHAQPEPTQPAVFQCLDGGYVYFALILAEAKAWSTLVTWMDDHDMAADLLDPAYQDLAFRQASFDHVQDLIEVFFLIQDSHDVYHEGQRRGLPIGRLNALEDLVDDEHLRARDFFVEIARGDDGRALLYPGLPYRFSDFETSPGRPPRLGEAGGQHHG